MKNKSRLITLLLICSLLLITTFVSYALFSRLRSGSKETIIETGGITFKYSENGRGIALGDVMPMSDEEGMVQTDYFDFTISSTTKSSVIIPYAIIASKTSNSDNIGNIVKIYLTEVNGNEETVIVGPTLYSDLEDDNNGKLVKVLNVPESSNYNKKYRFRMWVDEDASFSLNDYDGKTFSLRINVESKGMIKSSTDESGGSYTSITNRTYTNNLILAWNYVGTRTAPTHFPNKTDGYIGVGATCNGKTATWNNDLWYIALPDMTGTTVNCTITFSDIQLTGLAQMIFNDNELIQDSPHLNNSSNNTVDRSGLYVSTATNSGNPTYYFRGNVTNNFVDFAGKTWRIIRINEDGTVRLILDDMILEKNMTSLSDRYAGMYYTNGLSEDNAYKVLFTWYQQNIESNANYSSKVSTGGYYCEQAKVTYNGFSGANFTAYSAYVPNFSCQDDSNNHGIVSDNIGLITYDEVAFAGGYYNTANTSYYLCNGLYYWTMSPAGVPSQDGTRIWRVRNDGSLYGFYPERTTTGLRPVINLKAGVTATKDQTTGHYVVN